MKRRLLIIGLVCSFAACEGKNPARPDGGMTTPPPPPLAVTSVTITGTASLSTIGQKTQFSATGILSDGTSRDLTNQARWESSDTGVIAVSATGVVTAVGSGRATIVAEYQSKYGSLEVLVKPAGTFVLTGSVTEPGGVHSIDGARVEVTEGPAAGQFDVTRPGRGFVLYGVAGNVTIKASKDGYVSQAKQILITHDDELFFELPFATMPPQLPSAAHLTLTASAVCTQLPPGARVRTYTAAVTQTDADFSASLGGATFVMRDGGTPSFSGRVSPDRTVTFSIGGSSKYYYYHSNNVADWAERLGGSTYLTFNASGSGSLGAGTATGTLDGTFSVWDAPAGLYVGRRLVAACYAQDHRFTLGR